MGKQIKYFNNRTKPKKKPQQQTEEEMNEALERLPILVQVQSIQKFIDSLAKKEVAIRDWDHKDKVVRMIKSIGGQVYMLAESEVENAEEYEDALKSARHDNAILAGECRKLRKKNESLKRKLAESSRESD